MRSVPSFWKQSWREDVLERSIDSAEGLAFVFEDSDLIAGFVCAHDLGFRAYLSALLVSPEARGRGIGRQLVSHVETELIRRGCAVLFSDVWKDAAAFYRGLGWTSPDVVLLGKRLIDEEG